MPIDVSVLAGYYAARAAPRGGPALNNPALAGISAALAKRAQPLPLGTVPPWERQSSAPTQAAAATQRLREALQVKTFFNETDTTINKAGLSKDQRTLFALYKGLDTLKVLAERAGDSKTLAGERVGLAKRFAAGFEEVRTALAKTEFKDLTLLFGDKTNDTTTQALVPRTKQEYIGNLVSLGGSNLALPGVSASDSLTIQVKQGTGTSAIAVNFSDIVGDITIDSVVSLLNQKLSDAGMISRFQRHEVPGANATAPKRYGIKLQGVASETLSLSAGSASPALYVAGTSDTGTAQKGQITKLSNLGAAAPTSQGSETVTAKDGVSDARATATDAQGNVFVVGTATSEVDGAIVQGQQDVYLRKYDSANNLIWSRLLGATGTADGFALTVDSSGAAIIAGKVNDKLTSTATGGKGDSFVTKYDASGVEVFTRQVGSSLEDQANAITTDASGNIYVGGLTRGQIGSSGVTATGTDAYIQKLSSTGSLIYTRQFGSGSQERIAGLAVGSDGNLIASSVENGSAVVRKFDASSGTAPETWSVDLGAIPDGTLGGLTVDASGAVYVSGATSNASLNASGAASTVNAHAGGADGFVFKLTDNGASATANFVTYTGSSGTETGGGVTVTSDGIYLAGTTRQGLTGQTAVAAGKVNGFVQKFGLDGTAGWAYQFAGASGNSTAVAVTADASGSSVLDALGLPRGEITQGGSRLVTARSSVRAGDFFYLQIDNQTPRKISVQAGDTMRSLAQRINVALSLKGEAEVARKTQGDGIEIKTNDDTIITLKAGSTGLDALAGLGLTEGSIYGKNVRNREIKPEDSLKDINSFALRLSRDLNLSTEVNARRSATTVSAAIEAIKQASRRLVEGPPPPPQPEKERSQVPAFVGQQLANYQTALAAFGIGGGTLGQF